MIRPAWARRDPRPMIQALSAAFVAGVTLIVLGVAIWLSSQGLL